MLGIVPVVALFFGLPLEVRHVTLSTGQLAAAVGSEGLALIGQAPFWWCVAGIAVTAVLNLSVSFLMAFRVAVWLRGVRFPPRNRIPLAARSDAGQLSTTTGATNAGMTLTLRNTSGQCTALFADPPLGAPVEVYQDSDLVFEGTAAQFDLSATDCKITVQA